jgi:hypothetical protein
MSYIGEIITFFESYDLISSVWRNCENGRYVVLFSLVCACNIGVRVSSVLS